MKPREYFDQVVKPLIGDLQQDPKSLARLFAAVTTTYHIVDYLAQECSFVKNHQAVQAAILANFPDFKVIRAVALAQKHVEPNSVDFKVDNIRRSPKFQPVVPSNRLTRLQDLNHFVVVFEGCRHSITLITGEAGRYFDNNIEVLEDQLKKLRP